MNKILMPPSGQTTDQFVIGQWRKKVGDFVKRGDVLLEVETDKAVAEIQSYAKGYLLKILAKEGDTASVGDIIAILGEKDEILESAVQYNQKSEPITVEKQSKDISSEMEIIENEYVDIIPGSSPVIKEAAKEKRGQDLEKLHATQRAESIQASPAAKNEAKILNTSISEIAQALNKSLIKKQDVETYIKRGMQQKSYNDLQSAKVVPVSKMRKIIAQRLTECVQNVPTFQLDVDVDMSSCIRLREFYNNQDGQQKASYHDIIAKCLSVAIQKHELINAEFGETEIKVFKFVNVGIAVSTPQGLLVPVVKRVNELTIMQIAVESKKIIEACRYNAQSEEMLQGGTITISNLGLYPITRFGAILNPPQPCIVALGAIQDRAVIVKGNITVLPMMTITATFDHRLIDGAYGAAFLQDFKGILENPAIML